MNNLQAGRSRRARWRRKPRSDMLMDITPSGEERWKGKQVSSPCSQLLFSLSGKSKAVSFCRKIRNFSFKHTQDLESGKPWVHWEETGLWRQTDLNADFCFLLALWPWIIDFFQPWQPWEKSYADKIFEYFRVWQERGRLLLSPFKMSLCACGSDGGWGGVKSKASEGRKDRLKE